jgi:signal transduction histidine kinase
MGVVISRSDDSDRDAQRRRRRFLLEWLVFALSTLVLGVYVGSMLYAGYQRIDTEERGRLIAQAVVVEQNIERQMVAVDRSLASTRDDLLLLRKSRGVSRQAVNLRLQAISNAIPGVRTIVIIDADGRSIASNQDQLIGQDFHQGQRFQTARQGGNPAMLYVSAPFRTPLGVYAVSAAKVMRDDGDKIAGVVLAILEPEYFNTLLSSVRYAPDMLSSLIHGDGQIIFRIPDPQGIVGIDLAKPGSLFSQHITSGQPTDVYAGPVASTGEERLTVLHTIRPAAVSLDKPLVIAVSRTLSALFVPWRAEAFKQAGGLAALLLVAALVLTSMQRRKRAFDLISAAQLREIVAAKEKAELADRAKTKFLAAASHDLRQPVQSLIMLLELLKGQMDSPQVIKAVGRMELALDGLRGLLNSLLDVSRIDAGIVVARMQAMDVSALVHRLCAEYRPLCGQKDLRIRCAGKPDLRAGTDPALLERILRNLIENAIRYTDRGGLLIAIRRHGMALRIDVADTGIGIPADKVAYIFEEFYQVGNSARDRSKGLGLGLAIVRRLADLIGAEIRVRSRLGRGSRFTVLLPAVASESQD